MVLSFFTFASHNACVMILVFLSFAIIENKNVTEISSESGLRKKLDYTVILIIGISLFLFDYYRYESEKRYISALNFKARVDYINMEKELGEINKCVYPADVNNMPLDYYRGTGYYEIKDYGKSLALFNNAIRMAPGIAAIKNNLAAAYYQTGNIDSAKLIFKDLKNNYPNYIEPQINLLSLYTNTRNYDSAKILLHELDEEIFKKESVINYKIFLSIKENLK